MTRTERPDRRGQFLVQAMVLVVILAIVATGLLWLTFGRRVLLARAEQSEMKQQAAAGAQSRVAACLDGTNYGQASCDPSKWAACFPTSIAGQVVTVTHSGSPPNCQLAVTVGD